MAGPDPAHPRPRAFVQALRDLGLVDGRNIIIERRSAEGRIDRLDAIMQEMVGLGVDVIMTTGGPGVKAAQRATERIPIVAVIDNALSSGFIDSMARPGGNFTGIGENSPAIDGKRLQLLKEVAPAISRVAVLGYRPLPGPRAKWRDELDTAARSMRLGVLWLGADGPEELDAALGTIVRDRPDALYALSTAVNFAYRQRIGEFALKQRLPSIGPPEADAGMLLSYEADFLEMMRRAAVLVKKILDGAKPSDLPFEQPTKYLFVINLKVAKAIGLTIPPNVLLRADEVIR
jgi:putative ABC transport system substrate-binding protein